MTSRYRTDIVLKLWPSVPKALFGKGRHAQRVTSFLDRHVFYREFHVTAWKAIGAAAIALALAAWAVLALVLSLHATWRAERMRLEVVAREDALREEAARLTAARRDYHLLVSQLQPMNERVDQLSEFSQKLALAAGIDSLATELGATADERRLDVRLSERDVAELDRRFDQLGTFIDDRVFELSRTPSIAPLQDAFVPTDRFGFRSGRFITEPAKQARGGDGRQFHAGLDLAAPEGTAIRATADGLVHFAGHIPARQDAPASLYGNFVVLDHGNGIRTVYAHCSDLMVEQGEEVRRGQAIARVGSTGRSTGPHLHYEVVVNGRPMDPELFILDLALPDKRVRVVFEDTSLLLDEVDKLLGR